MLERELVRDPLFEARAKIGAWRQEYNQERPHSSLGYQTPAAFARQLWASPGSVPLEGTPPGEASSTGVVNVV